MASAKKGVERAPRSAPTPQADKWRVMAMAMNDALISVRDLTEWLKQAPSVTARHYEGDAKRIIIHPSEVQTLVGQLTGVCNTLRRGLKAR